jgi:hypothetical protein
MKLIKKYWAWIIAGIGTIIGILFLTRKYNDRKLDKSAKQIDANNQQIDQLQGKIEVIEEQRVEVKEEIKQQEKIIEALEDKKENITIQEPTDVTSAKANIIKKTNRGRKAKNK